MAASTDPQARPIVPTFGLTHLALGVRIRAAGGTVVDEGEFCPGGPYVFARDPDGYLMEIWFELPTPVDPVSLPRGA